MLCLFAANNVGLIANENTAVANNQNQAQNVNFARTNTDTETDINRK